MTAPVDSGESTLLEFDGRRRLPVVDVLRGLAIVLMALDHVREFFQAEQFDPLDLSQTTTPLFFTRWVTHFCPSLFILLAGAGIGLGTAPDTRARQARFVLARGVWLIVLELSVIHLGWFFNFQFHFALGQVIWAIGWSMIAMAGLIYLPAWLVTLIGVALIAGHNAFDGLPASHFGSLSWLWTLLHTGGLISIGNFSIYIAYPLIPWVGVMAAGFGLGQLLKWRSPRRNPTIAAIGIGMLAAFAVLRGGNLYGDPSDWTLQDTPLQTLLSMLNCQKYPPSLSYVLMTIGPVLALWPLWEAWRGPVARFLETFGRAPLFFYVLHLFVVHGLAVASALLQSGTVPDWLWNFPPGHAGPGYGVSLPGVYLLWIGVVAIHYPACRWYGRLKARNPRSLLRFL